MGKLTIDEEGFPAAPAAGKMHGFPDSGNSQWFFRNDAGLYIGDHQAAIVAQIAAHSADTYYQRLQLPSFSMQAGAVYEWVFHVSKGAAGIATPIYQIRIGAAGAIADTSRLTLTGVLQSGAADAGIVRVTVTCRNVGAAGVLRGSVHMQHNLATTGLASGATSPAGFDLVQGSAAAFDNSALSGQFIGLSVNPGAAGAWVVEQCIARASYS